MNTPHVFEGKTPTITISQSATRERRRIRIVWTCSDGTHHEHRTYLGAWICGKAQALVAFVTGER